MGLLLDQTWRTHQEKLTKQERGGEDESKNYKTRRKGVRKLMGSLRWQHFLPATIGHQRSRKFRDHQAEIATKDPQPGTSQ